MNFNPLAQLANQAPLIELSILNVVMALTLTLKRE